MPDLPVLSPWKQHVQKWKDCTKCELHRTRTNIVLARGSIPCDLLLIGESPGRSEDIMSRPFVGPAGYVLDDVLSRSLPLGVSYAMTNLVCCIPVDEEDDTKLPQPSDESVEACSGRLKEFIKVCDGDFKKLKLIVLVGGLARDWFDVKAKNHIGLHRPIPTVDILHPAAILRRPVAQRSLDVQRCSVLIARGIEAALEVGEKLRG